MILIISRELDRSVVPQCHNTLPKCSSAIQYTKQGIARHFKSSTSVAVTAEAERTSCLMVTIYRQHSTAHLNLRVIYAIEDNSSGDARGILEICITGIDFYERIASSVVILGTIHVALLEIIRCNQIATINDNPTACSQISPASRHFKNAASTDTNLTVRQHGTAAGNLQCGILDCKMCRKSAGGAADKQSTNHLLSRIRQPHRIGGQGIGDVHRFA